MGSFKNPRENTRLAYEAWAHMFFVTDWVDGLVDLDMVLLGNLTFCLSSSSIDRSIGFVHPP